MSLSFISLLANVAFSAHEMSLSFISLLANVAYALWLSSSLVHVGLAYLHKHVHCHGNLLENAVYSSSFPLTTF